MTSRRSLSPNPQIHFSHEGAGATRCCSPRLHPKIEATEEGAQMSRRRDGDLPATPASLPDDDNMLREILLRLPPQPSSLPRASAVCRRWWRLVTDPKFHLQFRDHHQKPPLLGVFQDGGIQGIVFTPVLDPPDLVPPRRFNIGCCSSLDYNLLDCRHGLVLLKDWEREEVVVCDPITGEQRRVTFQPEFKRHFVNGAVLCAAGDQSHVHGGCHSSPFKVVLVSICRKDNRQIACVYSSENGIWGNLISIEGSCENSSKPAVLVGSCLYWMGDDILQFDLDENSLTPNRGPPVAISIHYANRQIIRTEDCVVGFVILCYPQFHIWQRNVNDHGVATWVPWKTIEMHSILGLPPQIEGHMRGNKIIGYDEDTDEIFLYLNGSVYMVQLKLFKSRKLYESYYSTRVHSFKSFYTPGTSITGRCNGAEMLHDT